MARRGREPKAEGAIRVAIALAALGPCVGCVAFVGPTAGVTADRASVNIGAKGGARVYPTDVAGMLFGVEGGVVSRARGPCPCAQWRSVAAVGYADPPKQAVGRVGEEFALLAGGGRMQSGDGVMVLGALLGGQFALPISLSPRRELWQADDYVDAKLELVPDVTVLTLVPTRSGSSANAEVSAGLALRVRVSSAVLP